MGTAPATPLDGDPLIGHPQKWKDWGALSTHVMTVTGKEIAKAFYGDAPKRSYYTGCSTGGQQGLDRSPILSGRLTTASLSATPVVNRTWGHVAVVWDYHRRKSRSRATNSRTRSSPLLTRSAVAACGAKGNGLKSDPFIADPTACDFDPAALTCQGSPSRRVPDVRRSRDRQGLLFRANRSGGQADLSTAGLPEASSGSFNWGFLEAPANAPGEPVVRRPLQVGAGRGLELA